jgi:CheY-like chemotaxis protein
VLKAKFHNEFANVLNLLSVAEHREDYVDRALIEYTAASVHFEQVRHTRYQAYVENNLGYLFGTIGKFIEAHEHLDRAQALFTTLKDSGQLAQVDDTRAKVLLAEGRITEAEKLVRSAVRTLERGGEQSLLAEALTTHGMALARLGRHEEAQAALRRAVVVAEQAGDQESAGQAALSIIEESGPHLSREDLSATYERAAELLSGSQNLATFKRLCSCARRVLFLTHSAPAPPDWQGFSFKDAVRRYESHLIERALRDASGLVTRAAQLLGFKNHQSLIYVLKSRHKRLLNVRAPAVPRRRSVIRLRAPRRTPHCRAEPGTRTLTILHVEDNGVVSDAMKDTLGMEGWAVEVCADGRDALERIAGGERYDLLLLDQDLPGASGVEIVRRARSLEHRRGVPILMFCAADCEAEARGAGADAFLRKPADVSLVVETIERLLADNPALP